LEKHIFEVFNGMHQQNLPTEKLCIYH
jgi:hypothetical protein